MSVVNVSSCTYTLVDKGHMLQMIATLWNGFGDK